jgi:hypothetical protein
MGLNTELQRTGFPDDTGGIVKNTSKIVDNVFVTLDDLGNKWERVTDGSFRAAWVAGLDPLGDKTDFLQIVFDNSLVEEVIFDTNDITINGTLTIPATKKVTFQNSARIIGSGTVTGGVFDSTYWRHIGGTVTATPTTVNTLGSHFNIRTVDNVDFSFGLSDHTIILVNATALKIATIPSAASSTGRIIEIVNTGTGTITTSINYRKTPILTANIIQADETIRLHSNGTDWWLILRTTVR